MHYVHKLLCLISASPSTISFSQLVTSYLSVLVPALCTSNKLCYVISAMTTLYPEDSVSHTPPHPLALTTFLAPFPLMLLEPQRGCHRCTPFTANHSISTLWPAMILLNWPHFNLNYDMLFLNMSFRYGYLYCSSVSLVFLDWPEVRHQMWFIHFSKIKGNMLFLGLAKSPEGKVCWSVPLYHWFQNSSYER